MTVLQVEGWRHGPHSYALVNENQLAYLLQDPRLQVVHRDLPYCEPAWSTLPVGLPAWLRERTAALTDASPDLRPDAIYRISYPLRVYPGTARTLVFGTREFHGAGPSYWIGQDGTEATAEPGAIEFVTPTRWSAQGLIDLGAAPSRIHVVPHGIDPRLFRPAEPDERARIRRSLAIADDAFVFLNVGAMTWNKGVDLLLAAFAAHVTKAPGAVLVLKTYSGLHGNFQGAVWQNALKRCPDVTRADVRSAIRLIDRPLTSADVARLYQASDAYVSPYRAEGFNLPVLEAMGSGVAVAVTQGGATDDFCPASIGVRITASRAEHPDGVHLEPDPASVAAALERLRFDADERRRRAAAGRAHASANYAWEHVATRLADLIVRP